MLFPIKIFFICLSSVIIECKDYEGSRLGTFNTYAHQTGGEVFAIDEHTFLIKSFNYDGLGQDAYFWAGATVRPSNIGFIIPDENGKTNKLKRYDSKDIRIKLVEDKKIKSLKWLSVWDIRDNRNFADIYIADDFEPPAPQEISEFSRDSNDVRSGPVIILDSKTIKIPDFNFDGLSQNAYFWVGMGPQPNSAGRKIPNERGYIEPIGEYKEETLVLELPGNLTVFDIQFLAVWDDFTKESFGFVRIPDELNIPPALTQIIKQSSRLPNCQQLHQKLQLYWEVFGPQITFEVIAQIDANDYIAIGLSGSKNSSQMIGADVAVSYLKQHSGITQDYNITGKFPCTNIFGNYKGVCLDTKVGGVDNYQIHLFERVDSLTKITFRRNLINTGDEGDQVFEKKSSYIVWSIGKLNAAFEPTFHYIYPKGDIKIDFGRKAEKNCFEFSTPKEPETKLKPWGPLRLLNRTITTFYARIGDAGGVKGYQSSTGSASPGIVWYMNGLLAPILYVKRGRTYNFRVEGGNNPYNAHLYHPLYITNDPNGGFVEQTESERKKYHIYAGIEFDRKGRPTPTSAGRLCAWLPFDNSDKRKADNYHSFIQYRSALNYTCEDGNAAILQWTPNSSVPDLVYYQSYTHKNMGFKIVVLDDFSSLYFTSSTSSSKRISLSVVLIFYSIILLLKN